MTFNVVLLAVVALCVSTSALAAPVDNDQCEQRPEVVSALNAYDNNDYGRAAPAFEELAAAGDPCGQYWLGEMYHNGQGVPRDQGKYMDLIQQSARQGYSRARTRLFTISQ